MITLIIKIITGVIITYTIYKYIKYLLEYNKYKNIKGISYFNNFLLSCFDVTIFLQPRELKKYFDKFGETWRLTVGEETLIHTIDLNLIKEMNINKPHLFGRPEFLRDKNLFALNLFAHGIIIIL
jgi:hypothetical protein